METRKRQRSVILKLSMLLLPFAFCGIFEVIFWYYNAVTTLTQQDDVLFVVIFYNFLYNVIVPLKGFLLAIAFLLGSPEVRSCLKCCCFCNSFATSDYSSSTESLLDGHIEEANSITSVFENVRTRLRTPSSEYAGLYYSNSATTPRTPQFPISDSEEPKSSAHYTTLDRVKATYATISTESIEGTLITFGRLYTGASTRTNQQQVLQTNSSEISEDIHINI